MDGQLRLLITSFYQNYQQYLSLLSDRIIRFLRLILHSTFRIHSEIVRTKNYLCKTEVTKQKKFNLEIEIPFLEVSHINSQAMT